MQVADDSENVASNGSVFDVVHEFKRLHSRTWKLMTVDFTDTHLVNVDLVRSALTFPCSLVKVFFTARA